MRSLLVLPFLVFPAIVHADSVKTPDAGKMHTDDCERARKANKQCVINMGEGENIEGAGAGAGGIGAVVIETTTHNSLIHIRRDFIVEILKTADDL